MDFRTRIKNICQSQRITQKELAEKLGITDISLNKTLRGEYPQLQTLERIAQALDIPIFELFIDENRCTQQELNALIEHKGQFYKATTIEELQKIVEKLRDKS